MAWPITRYQTMVDGVPPTWNAAFGNALQDAINGLYAGTAAIGVGVSAAGVPSPAIVKGALARDINALARGAVRWTGAAYTVDWGLGIASAPTRGGAGIINIALLNPAASVVNGSVEATPNSTPGAAPAFTCKGLLGGGGATAQVQCFDSAGAAIDSHFNFSVYGY